MAPKQAARLAAAKAKRKSVATLEQFELDGTSARIDASLVAQFPLFRGKAPCGHPYPQAFMEGPEDGARCYVESVADNLHLLRHRLSSGRIISIDTCDFAMLNGGAGIAHLNMNNADNRVSNLKYVSESEARELLLEYEEPTEESGKGRFAPFGGKGRRLAEEASS